LDWQAESEKKRFLENFKRLKKGRIGNLHSLDVLRRLRGYAE